MYNTVNIEVLTDKMHQDKRTMQDEFLKPEFRKSEGFNVITSSSQP